MEHCASQRPTRIALIDDHPLTAGLILRLFAYLGYGVLHSDKISQMLALEQEEPFDFFLVNLALAEHADWLPLCLRAFHCDIPVIYYTPQHLLNDFFHAADTTYFNAEDDCWMAHSELFRFVKSHWFTQ